jgi:RHS repeat-associated protein
MYYRYDGNGSLLAERQGSPVFVGETRVVTKRRKAGNENYGQEHREQYFYHSDHLGSAQLVTGHDGYVYEHVEYTPYGELWIEQTRQGVEKVPYRFTGKEFDEETGLYYYGARYLDPKTSRWLSTDPAMGEYVPATGKGAGNLPGLGGIFNYVNLHTYHYAGNNPVKLVDPTGMSFERLTMGIDDGCGSSVISAPPRDTRTPRQVARADQRIIDMKPRIEVQRSEDDNGNNGKYYRSEMSLVLNNEVVFSASVQSTADHPKLNTNNDYRGGTLGIGWYSGTIINSGYKYALQIHLVGGNAGKWDAYALHPDVFTGPIVNARRKEGITNQGPFSQPFSLGCQIPSLESFDALMGYLYDYGMKVGSKIDVRIRYGGYR